MAEWKEKNVSGASIKGSSVFLLKYSFNSLVDTTHSYGRNNLLSFVLAGGKR